MRLIPARAAVSEWLGTAMLLAAVVGSGIMGDRLSHGDVFLTLLANSLATGAVLLAIILSFGGISGAHLNPAVSLCAVLQKRLTWSRFLIYVSAQVAGALTGVVTAHVMFGLSPFSIAIRARSGVAQVFSEFIATLGLLLVIEGCARFRAELVAFAVASYITAAYWFTSSTSFANPAVTFARSLSDTFVGIRPKDVPAFIVAQLAAAVVAAILFSWMSPKSGSQREGL